MGESPSTLLIAQGNVEIESGGELFINMYSKLVVNGSLVNNGEEFYYTNKDGDYILAPSGTP